jgi:hypothetical protein
VIYIWGGGGSILSFFASNKCYVSIEVSIKDEYVVWIFLYDASDVCLEFGN